MGGFAACNPPGGSVHALFCVKVNEITQGVGTTAVGVPSHTQELLRETVENRASRVPSLQTDPVHLNFQTANFTLFNKNV